MLILLLQFLVAGSAFGARELIQAKVIEPYLDLHTGPGEGYPIFYAVDRNEIFTVLKRKTDWYKVRTDRGKEGWVQREQLERTVLADSGEPFPFSDVSPNDYGGRKWEFGMLSGDFGGSDVLTVYGGYHFADNFAAELALSQSIGQFSESLMAHVNLLYYFYPEWRITPFFKLGTGIVQTETKSTLVEFPDQTDQAALAGAGLNAYVTRRFLFRAEYNNHVVFTSRDDNAEVDEWKIGFAFFF
jgi:hypothetical protein